MLSYLNETLGLCATERPWDDADRLPLFLRSGRTYSILTIENTDLLLIYLDVDQFQLSAFLKQRNKLLEFWKGDMVLCFRALTSYQRKVLIENHISFLVPGSQLYLPCLGILLQERTAAAQKAVSRLSPQSQFLLLYFIYCHNSTSLTKVQLSRQVGVSPMSITRSVQELESLGLVSVQKSGRSNYVTPVRTGKELFDIARQYFIDPVQKRLYVQQTNELMKLPLSGESALCERTMLNMPPVPCRAIDRKAYKRQQEAGLKRIDPAWQSKTDYMQLEVWRYDPVCFSHAGTVDIVSLAASFRSHPDERIEMAVDEMLEDYQW